MTWLTRSEKLGYEFDRRKAFNAYIEFDDLDDICPVCGQNVQPYNDCTCPNLEQELTTAVVEGEVCDE
jgi:predicted amidophosphoribosyltransferase